MAKPLSPEPKALLRPGEIRRFHNRRYFLSTEGNLLLILVAGASGVALGAWGVWAVVIIFGSFLVLRTLFVRLVPPKGGRRRYTATQEGLTVEAAGAGSFVAWRDILLVHHRPKHLEATEKKLYTTYFELIELLLGNGSVVTIYGANRQAKLSRIIIDQTRGPIAERLLAELHRDGSVEFGNLRFSAAGVTAEAGTMPWQRGWKVTRRFSQKGILLQIETAEYGLRTYVPEETVARDLLATLVAAYAR